MSTSSQFLLTEFVFPTISGLMWVNVNVKELELGE